MNPPSPPTSHPCLPACLPVPAHDSCKLMGWSPRRRKSFSANWLVKRPTNESSSAPSPPEKVGAESRGEGGVVVERSIEKRYTPPTRKARRVSSRQGRAHEGELARRDTLPLRFGGSGGPVSRCTCSAADQGSRRHHGSLLGATPIAILLRTLALSQRAGTALVAYPPQPVSKQITSLLV